MLGIAAAATYQDKPDEKLQFEVASIKPSAPDMRGMTLTVQGGPGTGDPTRIHYQNLSLHNYITIAYGVDYFQLTGPEFLESDHYIIDAKVPEGATREQLPTMMRNLLIDRFKLAAHLQDKELPVSVLIVAKGGLKMKEHVEKPKQEGDAPAPRLSRGQDAEGYPILDGPGMIVGDHARWRAEGIEIGRVLGQIQGQLGRKVTDQTGLTGKYDFVLSWIPGQNTDSATGPDFLEALQQQLGLKVETKKGMVPVVVVEHIERTPTEN
jgi:uncharacterized protein (TIGR03435 family)